MLWRDLKAWQVYGANTDVGKTIVSTILCRALQKRAAPKGLLYLKPVSTGPQDEADDGHIRRYVPGIDSKCISQFSRPLSPHLAALKDGNNSIPTSNGTIVKHIRHHLSSHAQSSGRYAILETAGGVLSPAPSGTPQADAYRPLRLPAILVGDSKLGGIGTTISAFESLHVRGYDLDNVILFDDPQWGNHEYLAEYFAKHDISTTAIPKPPPRNERIEDDEAALSEYYSRISESKTINSLVEHLTQKHFNRVSTLASLPSKAEQIVWHPFRQYSHPSNIIAIDSAYDDHFTAYNGATDSLLAQSSAAATNGLTPLVSAESSKPMTTSLFDASASWWTQGLGHGNPSLALTVAHAAGRYGHVMFAHSVHAPALDLAYNLLSTLQNPRLSRVFYTDNGSTAMEVGVKMALRASCERYGWSKNDGGSQLSILGFKGSYHGDTIGVMNASEPSVFNEKVDWHAPWGHWLDPPSLLFKRGQWELTIPDGISTHTTQTFGSLNDVLNFEGRQGDTEKYEAYIRETLTELVQKQGKRFGALVMEPILMGAGGMIFVDPLFQRTLITTIRANPELIGVPVSGTADGASDPTDWSGMPVIADEVFTGLYRLGRASSTSFLSSRTASSGGGPVTMDIAPDISAHAKLLTAGLVPLSITTASNSIFNAFLGESKTDALLHGHSYTAHAIGCMVANKALATYKQMDTDGSWSEFKEGWRSSETETPGLGDAPYSFFSPELVNKLSHHPRLDGCLALGTVLALKVKDTNGGYSSMAGAKLQQQLLTTIDSEGSAVHSRILGDVIYFMTSLTTPKEEVDRLGQTILTALDTPVPA